jgi:membrane-bound lytic murein transglycosylase D
MPAKVRKATLLILFFSLIIIEKSFSFQQEQELEQEPLVELIDSTSLETFSANYNYDFVPDVPYEVIADRISCLSSNIPLIFNSKVKGFIDYFTVRDRNYTRMILKRQHVYFPLFEKYLKKYNLPDELKYLAVVESGLNPRAVSRAGAVGLWQFMPATGRGFHLNQDYYFDERMDPEKATEAACKYLKELYGYFHDWELALASYNAGPGNVRKAIRKSGNKKGFWEVYDHLPKETRSYVPQFVAIIYVMNYAFEHNFLDENFEYPMEAKAIKVNESMDLEKLSEQLNICSEDLQKLNPEIKRSYFKSHQYTLRIPADKENYIAENRSWLFDSVKFISETTIASSSPAPVASPSNDQQKIVYKVKKGDALGTIAARNGVSINQIKSWNNLKSNNIFIGQNLVIFKNMPANSTNKTAVARSSSPTSEKAAATNNVSASAKISTSSPKTYQVQPGDTLWKISQKFDGISIEKIKKLNNLKDNNIKVGQKLVIGS